MSSPRSMSRLGALRISAYAAIGMAGSALLLAAVVKLAAYAADGGGPISALLAIASLLLAVAFLIGVLVLMYGLYAAIRGPRPGESGDDAH